MRYASETSVPVERTRGEIETTLTKYGADQFGYMQDTARGLASIQFRAHERHIRFTLKLPAPSDEQFAATPSKRHARSPEARYAAWEQACRQRWRALALCIKAKLEAVECGISEFEEEFLAHIVLPNGGSVSDLIRPQITKAYQSGRMPKGLVGMLPYDKPAEEEEPNG